MAKAFVFLAEGFEEIEALCPVDILRRGGVDVTTVGVCSEAGVSSPCIRSSHRIGVTADIHIEEFMKKADTLGKDDVLIFPGGMPGSVNLRSCEPLMQVLIRHFENSGKVAAICAAPSVVLAGALGSRIKGMSLTCYPSFEPAIEEAGARVSGEGVCHDGNLITAKGAGPAMEFALAILAWIKGEEAACEVAAAIQLQ